MALPLGPAARPIALLVAVPPVPVMAAVEHEDSRARVIIIAVPAERIVGAVSVIGRAVAVVAVIAAIAHAIAVTAVSAAAERKRARRQHRDVGNTHHNSFPRKSGSESKRMAGARRSYGWAGPYFGSG